MIAADTSSLSAYFKGEKGSDVERIDSAFLDGELRLPPVVLTELLSDPALPERLRTVILVFERLDPSEGYWQRAGEARRKLKVLGLRAKIADALIAQSCIDHDVALITRDQDFQHFAKHCGLKLA
jgi:predicted nucleic acid-binding protein